MTKVLCVGTAVIDFVFHLEYLAFLPKKHWTEDAAIAGGGCAANAAVAVSRLGGKRTLRTSDIMEGNPHSGAEVLTSDRTAIITHLWCTRLIASGE